MIRPTPLEKESELPFIRLEWLTEIIIKKSRPNEGPSKQGTSSTLTIVLGKAVGLGRETPILGVSEAPDTQKDAIIAEGPKDQQ